MEALYEVGGLEELREGGLVEAGVVRESNVEEGGVDAREAVVDGEEVGGGEVEELEVGADEGEPVRPGGLDVAGVPEVEFDQGGWRE